jgi:5-methylcytosine-specific restriction endonuclease McrA
VGKYEFSQMTDHIVPVHGPKDPLFWIHSNHQGLSNMCHQIKTREDIEKGLTR